VESQKKEIRHHLVRAAGSPGAWELIEPRPLHPGPADLRRACERVPDGDRAGILHHDEAGPRPKLERGLHEHLRCVREGEVHEVLRV
jgi:hypothetical protein